MTPSTDSVWQWTAFHPEWRRVVHSHVIDTETTRLVVDPQLPEGDARVEILDRLRSSERELAIVLLLDDHRRSAYEIALETEATVIAHEAFADRIGCATELVDRLPFEIRPGVTALATGRGDELMLWSERAHTLVAGDVLLGDENGGLRICPQSWLDRPRAEVADQLQTLLELPVERILLGHGEPVTAHAHDLLRHAIADAR